MVARVASLSGERMARMSPRDSMGVVVCYSLGWGVTGSVVCCVAVPGGSEFAQGWDGTAGMGWD